MISVLIPAPGSKADGIAYADPPSLSEYAFDDGQHLDENCAVRSVPPDALQALLRSSSSFATYEKRFGAISASDRARLLALFKLVEEERTWDPRKREEFAKWTLEKHRALRKEAKAKRSPEEAEKMAQFLAKHDIAQVEQRGVVGTLANELNSIGTLRVWFDNRNETLSPGVFVGSFPHALQVLLLLNLSSPESIAICARCDKQFVRTKTTQAFCSLRCGNNARQARQRNKRKGAKNVTHETR